MNTLRKTCICVAVAMLGVLNDAPVFAYEAQLKFNGDDPDLATELRSVSRILALRDQETVIAQDVVAAGRADYERLLQVLYNHGLFASTITIGLDGREAAEISPVAAPSRIDTAIIVVSPGPVFRFGKATVAPLAPETTLPPEFATGAPAGVGAIQGATATAIEKWRETGHAKAGVKSQNIVARHPQQQLDAEVALAPGPLLRFGNLVVRGNKDVRTRRVAEIAGLPKGQTFSPSELERSADRLRRTGTFRAVAMTESENIGPNDTLDIVAQVAEAPKRRLGYGAELSSLEGLGLNAFWMHRNLLGGAERVRIEGEASGIGGDSGGNDFRLALRFDRPATFNPDNDFYAETQLELLDEVNFTSRTFSIEAGFQRYPTPDIEYSFGVGFRTSKTTDDLGKRTYVIATVPVTATFDRRNDRLNATSGYFASASLTPFANLRGTSDGVRSTLDLRTYRSVGPSERLTFAVRGQVGSVFGPDLASAPADFLFYSGGGGTVRGQQYQSLAVNLGGGDFVGGRSFLGLSGEARVKTGEKISLVGFYDAGYIGAEQIPDGRSGEWHSGAGLGIRYDTGIGPIRLDLAVPVGGAKSGRGLEIYIGIGQAF